MAEFIDDVAARLVSQGVGVLGSSIFTGSKAAIPSGAGPFITLTETGGTAPTRVQNQNPAATQRPTAQIAVRATSYKVAMAKARAAYVALDGIFNTTLSGTFYLSVVARQEPTDLGMPDDAGRPMITFNIDAERRAS